MFPLFVCFCLALVGFSIGYTFGSSAPIWLRVTAIALVFGGVFGGIALLFVEAIHMLRSLVRMLTGR
jgi:hypothetical protein